LKKWYIDHQGTAFHYRSKESTALPSPKKGCSTTRRTDVITTLSTKLLHFIDLLIRPVTFTNINSIASIT